MTNLPSIISTCQSYSVRWTQELSWHWNLNPTILYTSPSFWPRKQSVGVRNKERICPQICVTKYRNAHHKGRPRTPRPRDLHRRMWRGKHASPKPLAGNQKSSAERISNFTWLMQRKYSNSQRNTNGTASWIMITLTENFKQNINSSGGPFLLVYNYSSWYLNAHKLPRNR